MILVGVYGGTASGKTELLNIMKEHGYSILDCDEIANYLLYNAASGNGLGCKNALTEKLGVAYKESSIDGEVMDPILKSDETYRITFMKVLSIYIVKEFSERLDQLVSQGVDKIATDAVQTLDGAIDIKTTCDILVTAPFMDRLLRLARREGITIKEAEYRVNTLGPVERDSYRYVLENNTGFDQFRDECIKCVEDIDKVFGQGGYYGRVERV